MINPIPHYQLPFPLVLLYQDIQRLEAYIAEDKAFFNGIAAAFRQLSTALLSEDEKMAVFESIEKLVTDVGDNVYDRDEKNKADAILLRLNKLRDQHRQEVAIREAGNFTRHPLIDDEDLQHNGKLLPDDTIAELLVHEQISSQPNHRLSKKALKQFNLPFSLIMVEGRLCAIYHGDSKNKLLGRGSYGKTKIAQDLQTKEFFVIKVIETREAVEPNEIAMLWYLGYLKGVVLSSTIVADGSFFKAETKTHVVMTLFYGNTLHHIPQEANPSLDKMLLKLYHSALDLNRLHGLGIMHKDIKPANIVVNAEEHNPQAHLIDFGFSQAAENVEFALQLLPLQPNVASTTLVLRANIRNILTEASPYTYVIFYTDSGGSRNYLQNIFTYSPFNKKIEYFSVNQIKNLLEKLLVLSDTGMDDEAESAAKAQLKALIKPWHIENTLYAASKVRSGTPAFIAPELMTPSSFNGQFLYTFKTDTYAFGVTLFMLVAPFFNDQACQFTDKQKFEVKRKQLQQLGENENAPLDEPMEKIKTLMLGLTEEKPEARLSLSDCIEKLNSILREYFNRDEAMALAHVPAASFNSHQDFLRMRDYCFSITMPPEIYEMVLRLLNAVIEKNKTELNKAACMGMNTREERLGKRIEDLKALKTTLHQLNQVNFLTYGIVQRTLQEFIDKILPTSELMLNLLKTSKKFKNTFNHQPSFNHSRYQTHNQRGTHHFHLKHVLFSPKTRDKLEQLSNVLRKEQNFPRIPQGFTP